MARPDPGKEGITRRSLLLGGVSTLMFGVLAGRLYQLQFLKADQYQLLAEGNRVKLQVVPPARGRITDRNGVALADRQQNFRLLLEPENSPDARKTLDALQAILPLTEAKQREVRRQLRGRMGPPQLLKEYLSWDELSTVEFHAPQLPGVRVDVGEMRRYPMGEQTAHLLGYVGAVAIRDLPEEGATNYTLLKQPGFKIGKGGLEQSLEPQLQGKAGARYIEVDVHGQHARELKRVPAEAGHTMRLGLDAELQRFATERLGEESGSIVVLDVTDGSVVALASTPAFDPNRFSGGITTDYWKELNRNIRKPLLNKATHGIYPPGSTFKMVTGLAGLESGVIDRHTSFHCPGYWYLGNHKFNCWKEGGHGTVSIERAIAVSCDTFFYNVGQRLGVERLVAMGKKFGFGRPTSALLPSESGALLPSPAWKQARYKAPWQGGDTINIAIGQGYMLATPMQLAVMTARIANGGREVSPRFVLSEPVESEAKKPPLLGIRPESLQLIRNGMEAVSNSTWGTAYASRIPEVGMEMAGKTGTAQVHSITQRGVNQNSLPWHLRHHAWFVGYAPVDKPRFATCVLIEHGGGGASAAAPVARDVLKKAQELAALWETPT